LILMHNLFEPKYIQCHTPSAKFPEKNATESKIWKHAVFMPNVHPCQRRKNKSVCCAQ